jgi:subtilisin family serine protease
MKRGYGFLAASPIGTGFLTGMIVLGLLSGCGGGGGGGEKEPTVRSFLPYEENPLYWQQWSLHYDGYFYATVARRFGIAGDPEANIHLPQAAEYTGKGVKVAIIDDALDTMHEDLKGAVVRTYDVETGQEDVTPVGYDMNHGTEVTGLIAATSNRLGITGVAPQVEVYFIKMPFDRTTTISMVVEAIEKAKEWQVDVLNCSWGTGDVDISVADALRDLAIHGRHGKGTVIVFASGNEGGPIGHDESSLDEVLAVGATNIKNERSYYSNYGDALDVMAPGGEWVGLTTLDQMGEKGSAFGDNNYLEYDEYRAFGGTSAAAPIVSGVAALILQANPALRREEVFEILRRTADKVGDEPYIDGHNPMYGYGKINVARALLEAKR